MKRIVLSIALISIVFALSAQSRFVLKGRVVDGATTSPVGFATVSLHRDSTAAAAVAADADGTFELQAAEGGSYRLELTMVGYAPRGLEVELSAPLTDLGDVELVPGVDIADVVVEVQKPLVVSDAEKMTYSVEDDPQASTSTLEEIIRKVPQLSLDADGNVLLNGQSNYKILLNGRSATSLSNNFKDVIKSMPASQIKKIEVITHPSTKYEAEGVGGIINLITDRGKQFDGYNGGLSASSGFLNAPFYHVNGHAAVQLGKFAASFMSYYNYFNCPDEHASTLDSWRENVGAETVRYQTSSSRSTYRGHNCGASLDLSYAIDTLNLITLSGWISGGKNRNWTNTQTGFFNPEMEFIGGYDSFRQEPWHYVGGTITLNYEHTFNREGHTLTVSDEYEIDPDDGGPFIAVEGTGIFPSYASLRTENNRSHSNTVQIDYANPLNDHHNIEAGLKHIFRSSDADADQQDFDAEGAAAGGPQLDRMNYRQHILGIYAGYGFTFTKWSGRAGARMERTWNNADVAEPDRDPYVIRNTLFNVIPYLSFTFKPVESHTLSLSYTQRLQRPDISMLSPAVDDTAPTSLTYGNPGLKSAVFHSVNLQYSYFNPKWSTLFGLTALVSNNCMTNYTFTSDGIAHNTYSGDVHTRTCGFNGSFSVRPSSKLNLSISYSGQYAAYDFAPMDIHTDRFMFRGNINLDAALWKDARLFLGGGYSNGTAALGSYDKGWQYHYIGLKQSLLKQTLDISVTLSDPFEKTFVNSKSYRTPTYIAYSRMKSDWRRLNIGISWRFGKQDVSVKRASRTIENDDRSDGGKSSGAGAGAGR